MQHVPEEPVEAVAENAVTGHRCGRQDTFWLSARCFHVHCARRLATWLARAGLTHPRSFNLTMEPKGTEARPLFSGWALLPTQLLSLAFSFLDLRSHGCAQAASTNFNRGGRTRLSWPLKVSP